MKKKNLLTLVGSICLILVLVALLLPACNGEETPVTPPPPESPTPPSPAEFELASLDIEPAEVTAGETVTITAVVENTGGSEGTYTAVLTVDGVTVETKELTISAGASQTASFSMVKDTPGTYEVGVGELSASLVVIDTWTLSSPLWFLGTFSFDTVQKLGAYQGSILGGNIDYVYQQLSRHWDSMQESNTLILFSTSYGDPQRLGEWPEQYKEVCPFSIDELTVNNLPFALLRRQDNGLIRAIILVDNEPDILTFITVIADKQVPVSIPWTLTNGEVTAIEED